MNLPHTSKLYLDDDSKMDNTFDLSAYFFYHSINILTEGGILGFISSETWMNSKYGLLLQKIFLNNTIINKIIRFKFNVFDDADTKASIIILKRKKPNNEKIVYNFIDNNEEMNNFVFSNTKIISQNHLKIGNWISQFKPKLPDLNVPLIPLMDIGTVTYGEITGFKNFFVLSKHDAQKYNIPKRYLTPTISKNTPIGLLDDKNADEYMLNVNEPIFELKNKSDCKGIIAYLKKGANMEITPKRGTNRNPIKLPNTTKPKTRKIWYSLNLKKTPSIIFRRILNKKLDLWENNGKFHTTNTLAHFTPDQKIWTRAYLAFFSTSYYQFHLETIGTEMGGGALSLEVYNYKASLAPDFNKISYEQIKKLNDVWIKNRNNINKNQEIIDQTVLSILGLTSEQISKVIDGLEMLVKIRLKQK